VDEVFVKASMLSSMSSSEVGEFSKVYHLHKHTWSCGVTAKLGCAKWSNFATSQGRVAMVGY
jgi:hypothetical protein